GATRRSARGREPRGGGRRSSAATGGAGASRADQLPLDGREATELGAVRDQVDRDDAAARDGEADDGERPPRPADDEARAAVDERGACERGERRSLPEDAPCRRRGS